MQVSTKFTIAIHILAAAEYFEGDYKITSSFLSNSIGSNPVIIRNIMSDLQSAGIIETKRGTGGITVSRPLNEISFLDVYNAVETNNSSELFKFHEHTNPNCPVGRVIHEALGKELGNIQTEFEKELKKRKVSEVYDEIVELNTNRG